MISFSSIDVVFAGQTQSFLPVPGTQVLTSQAYNPVLIKGMTLHPNAPLRFDFIIDSGDSLLDSEEIQKKSEKLIKYFMASMTVPQDDLWVNLSPYESNRIIPEELGKTGLGRDLLAQDYILKQLTASLIDPRTKLGKKFWDRVYEKAREKFKINEVPINTFNKVWILPETASVYEHGNTVYIVDSRLKVLMDSDYASLVEETASHSQRDRIQVLGEEIVRDVIIPEIEKEVNFGTHFAPLRQIYHSLILARWYKERVAESILKDVYVDQNKVVGIQLDQQQFKKEIYERYMEAYQKGVFDFIQEDYDELSKTLIPRKYFSGGIIGENIELRKADRAMLPEESGNQYIAAVNLYVEYNADSAVVGEDNVSLVDQAQKANIPSEDTFVSMKKRKRMSKKHSDIYAKWQKKYDRDFSKTLNKRVHSKKKMVSFSGDTGHIQMGAAEIALSIHGIAIVRIMAVQSFKWFRRFLTDQSLSQKSRERIERQIQDNLHDTAKTLAASREVRKTFLKWGGYEEIDFQQSLFKSMGYDVTNEARSRKANAREILIHQIGAEFIRILKQKYGFWEEKDTEIVHFLMDLLDDTDSNVATAAVQALNGISTYIQDIHGYRQGELRRQVTEKYKSILRDKDEDREVLRGVVAEGLIFFSNVESVNTVLDLLKEEESPWVQIHLLDALGFLMKEQEEAMTPRYKKRYYELVDQLFSYIEDEEKLQFVSVSVIKNALEAIGYLREPNDLMILEKLHQVIWNTSVPTVQEAAVWAWTEQNITSPHFEKNINHFLLQMMAFVRGGYKAPENIYLKQRVFEMLKWLMSKTKNKNVWREFRKVKKEYQQSLMDANKKKKQSNGRPVIFIDITEIVKREGDARKNNFEVPGVRKLLKHYRKKGHIVVPTQAFRENRDAMTLEDSSDGKIRLRLNLLAKTVDRLVDGKPTIVEGRNNNRFQTSGQNHIYVPEGIRPIIVVGLSGEKDAVQSKMKRTFDVSITLDESYGSVLNDYDYTDLDNVISEQEMAYALNDSAMHAQVLESMGRYDHILVSGGALFSSYFQRNNRVDSNIGGIDMNDITIDRFGTKIDIEFDSLSTQGLNNVPGFKPVIIDFLPINNLQLLLGVQISQDDNTQLSYRSSIPATSF